MQDTAAQRNEQILPFNKKCSNFIVQRTMFVNDFYAVASYL